MPALREFRAAAISREVQFIKSPCVSPQSRAFLSFAARDGPRVNRLHVFYA
jgi:hypothetical protein